MKTLIICIIFISNIFSANNNIFNWELAVDNKEIKVYTRKVEHSSLKEFKAEGVIEASVDDVLATILDIENYPKWMDSYKTAKILNQKDNNIIIFYALIETPWPIANRDVVLELSVTKTENQVIVNLEGKSNYIEKKEDLVRLPIFNGNWIITPKGEKTHISTQVHTEPGGYIPSWFSNMIITQGPLNTMKGLKKLTEK